jgi:hypothetical protein
VRAGSVRSRKKMGNDVPLPAGARLRHGAFGRAQLSVLRGVLLSRFAELLAPHNGARGTRFARQSDSRRQDRGQEPEPMGESGSGARD